MSAQPSWPRRRLDCLLGDARSLRDGIREGCLRRLSEAERDRCRDSLAALADAVLGIGQALEEPGLDVLETAREAPFPRREAA